MELTAIKENLEYEADIESVPVKCVVDYLITKKVRSSTVKKLPSLNEPSNSPDIKLSVATRDFEEAKQILENEKGIYDAKKKKIEKEWEELESKEIELSEEFKNNDKAIKNNERGWKKQEKQTAVELAGEERVQDEITNLEEKIKLYESIETELRKKVSMFEIYEDFLQQVVHEYPIYCCVDDVLNHYESLNETRDEMKELYLKSVKLVERMRKEVEDITEEGMIHIFNLSQSFHRLRTKEYFLQKELCHWAQMIQHLQDIENNTYQDIAKAVEGVWLVYLNICRAWNQDPQLKKKELKAQLDYIVEHACLMKCILEESENYISEFNQKGPGNRELNKWSTDYEDFQLVNSQIAQSSGKALGSNFHQ